MKAKFHIIRKVVDMEHPKNNSKKEYEITVEKGDYFEKDGESPVFKLLAVGNHYAEIEYNRHYAVRKEIKGYEFTTKFEFNETKEIISMWGKEQITYKITYIGADEKTLQEAVESNPVENYIGNKDNKVEENKTLDDVVAQQNASQQNTIL